MKKIFSVFLLSALMLFVTTSYAQNGDYELLKKKIAKSDEAIKDPKAKQKYQTWAKRGKLFLEAYTINTKYLTKGMDAKYLPFFGADNGNPPYYGQPKSKSVEGDFEVWNYPRVKIYIKDGLIDHWEDLQPVDPDALEKSYEAYKKAIELDSKGKFKNKKSTMEDLQELRQYLFNKSVEYYSNQEFDKAEKYIEMAIDLFSYPRLKSDTLVDEGASYYYGGIFAYNAKDPEKAKEFFKKAIDNSYEIGACYQYIAQIMYEQKDTTAAVKMLEDAAQKYPEETKIIYSLIDYYTPRGEYDKAFKYIDKAIEMTPDMAVLYIVKGNAYEKIFEDLQKKYFALLKQADSLDQAAFRARNNKEKHDELIKERDDILNNQVPPLEKQVNEYFDNAIKAYKTGIEKEENADYYYTIAYFYFKTGVNDGVQASNLRKVKTYIEKLNKNYEDYLNEAKTYAEKAYNLNPDDKYTIDLLAKIYYRLKMYDKATEMRNKLK